MLSPIPVSTLTVTSPAMQFVDKWHEALSAISPKAAINRYFNSQVSRAIDTLDHSGIPIIILHPDLDHGDGKNSLKIDWRLDYFKKCVV